MSTRSVVVLKYKNEKYQFYHHCDGYLSGVGTELKIWLDNKLSDKERFIKRCLDDWKDDINENNLEEYKGYAEEYFKDELTNLLLSSMNNTKGYETERNGTEHGDKEFFYVIDIDKEKLFYNNNWGSKFIEREILEADREVPKMYRYDTLENAIKDKNMDRAINLFDILDNYYMAEDMKVLIIKDECGKEYIKSIFTGCAKKDIGKYDWLVKYGEYVKDWEFYDILTKLLKNGKNITQKIDTLKIIAKNLWYSEIKDETKIIKLVMDFMTIKYRNLEAEELEY